MHVIMLQVEFFWVVKLCNVVVGHQQHTTQCHNPEELDFNRHHSGNPKYHTLSWVKDVTLCA